MARTTMIKVRRDSSANWVDVVLVEGEFGYDTTTKELKIGDGTTVFQSLGGINADMLDGEHGFSYATSTHTHAHDALTGLTDDDHTQYAYIAFINSGSLEDVDREGIYGVDGYEVSDAPTGYSTGGAILIVSEASGANNILQTFIDLNGMWNRIVNESGGAGSWIDMLRLARIDEMASPTDVTTLNVSTSAHGLLPKLPDDDDKVLDGTGSWVDSDALPSISAPTRTIWLSAGAGMPNTTDGCEAWAQTELETNDIQIGYLEYPTAVGRSAQWLFAMPDNYDGGTITAKFYWTFSSGSGDVMWGIYGRAFDDDEALDQSLGSGVTVTDTGLSANDLHKTAATSALTLGGTPSGGDLVIIQIARLGQEESDTHGGSALLLGVKLEYTTDTYSD